MAQDIESDAELKNLAAVPYQLISPANNKSIIGIFQDSMLGCYRFTRENVNFTPREAMNLLMMFNRVNEMELRSKGDVITNFDILSQIMPPLTMKYNISKDDIKPEEYATSNLVLEIRNGQYIRGQMNKGVIDAHTKGLIQRICNDFGNLASSNFIDDLQNIITEYMKSSAYSVGISDLKSDHKTNQEIIQRISDKKTQVKTLIDQTQLGVFQNETGRTNVEEFESQVNNILNQATAEAGKIGRENLNKSNRFVIMVNAGSKGSELNIAQMISCLGQQNVDGKRIPYGFEQRTLPHYSKFDDSPGARGFVESSYINGLSPQELFFHAMGGREGLIDTAVKSVTWETPIVIIENKSAKYTEIGRWIDAQLDDPQNKSEVQHFTERQMELLNINEGDVFIPTTDENGVVTWGPVTAITRHDPGKELYEIKTTGGRSVIVTESKSLLIWNEETKKLKEMPTPEIKVGDCVPVTRELCEPPVVIKTLDISTYLPKSEYVYGTDFNKAITLMHETMENRKKIPDGWWDETNGKQFTLPFTKKASLQRTSVRSNMENVKNGFVYPYSGKRRDFCIPEHFALNEINGIFIGLFLADGNAYKTNVTITNNNENIQTFVKKWFVKHSVQWVEKKRINKIGGLTTTITGNSSVLSSFITKWVGHGAENKHVPTEAFIAQEEFVIGLLNGYFSGDGTIGKNSVEVGSASKRLIEGISMLCSRLAIFGKVFQTQLKSNNLGTKNIKPTYRFAIRAQWGQTFAEKISLLEEKKQERLRSIEWGDAHRNFDTYNDVVLDRISEIKIIGVEEHPKVYDLTIPTTLNFGLANGLQVRDTSSTGYIQRRLIKGLEDLMVAYDMTIRTNKNKIVQFSYGDDGIDTVKVENQPIPIVTMSIQDIYSHFNILETTSMAKELGLIFEKKTLSRVKKQKEETNAKCKFYTDMMIDNRAVIIKNVFKNKGDSSVSIPVAFSYIIGNIQGQQHINSHSLVDVTLLEAFDMIETNYNHLEKLHYVKPTLLFKILYFYYLSPKHLLINKRFNRDALTILLNTISVAYKRAIVSPGEMVGMTAGQSIGEISTQMSASYYVRNKIIGVNKLTREISHMSVVIGEFCDTLIRENPHMTFDTGHANSVETLLEHLDTEYYIVGVSENEKTSWNKISHVSRHPVNGQMMKVTTRSGRVVETTTSHSHLIRKNHRVVPIVGADMKEGMRIPVCKHIDNTFVKDTVTIGTKTYKLDALFGWFVGAYLAEGNINRGSIAITNVAEHYIQKTIQFAALFGKEAKPFYYTGEYGPGVATKFSEKELANFLVETCDTGSFVKRVPDFAFTAPNEFKAAMFQGYFDGDGNFQCDEQHHQMRACSRSEQLVKDLALILNYFGIVACIKTEMHKGLPLYHLNISPKYARVYEEHIGSVLHQEKLADIIRYVERDDAKKVSEQIDKINGLGNIIAHCAKTLKLPGQSRNYGHCKKKESIGRATLEKYLRVFESHPDATMIQSEIQLLKQAANANVMWDEIVSIELYTPDQHNFVYDFTVPGNQTFMTDYGVIVHNTLNTFHSAGISAKSNVTRGVPRLEEILSLSSEPKNPSLTIHLKPGDETDKDKAHSIMYMIEHTKLQEIVQSIEICFDPDDLKTLIHDDKTTIEQYRAFETMVNECMGEQGPAEDNMEKSKWIIRMIMDPEIMLEKNITMDDVHFTLNNSYTNEISCIYSDYNADKLVFRIRMNNILKQGASRSAAQRKTKANPLDQSDQIYILKNFQDELLHNIVLRGIKGINKVSMRKIKDNMVEQAGVFKKQDIWVLDTIGTNLLDVLGLDYVDSTRIFSNNIVEVYDILGIEAARQTIYNEIADVIEFDGTYINYHHFSVLCDRMTFSSKMISIFRHGINNDNIGPIAKASFEETPEMFLKAARHGELDTMRGISANVMCGQEGYFGTSVFQVVLDLETMNQLEEEKLYEKGMNEWDAMDNIFQEQEPEQDKCSTMQMTMETNVISIKTKDLGKGDDEYDPGF